MGLWGRGSVGRGVGSLSLEGGGMTPGGLVVRLVAIALLSFGEAVTMWTNAARSLVLLPVLVEDFSPSSAHQILLVGTRCSAIARRMMGFGDGDRCCATFVPLDGLIDSPY